MCGITSIEDALAAVDAGADALGFVFYAKSPRAVTLEKVRSIIDGLPPFVTTVALFVDAEVDFIQQVIRETQVDLLQFHGNESACFCNQFNRPYIKAIRMQADTDLLALSDDYISAQGLLLDAYVKGIPGGTGETFNWQWVADLPAEVRRSVVLAGGLIPDNVAQAIRVAQPYAVDVSGGLEVRPGQKSLVKIQHFMRSVRSVG